MDTPARIAVVIPCYRVRERVLHVIEAIGAEVGWIFVVDDACPEQTGAWVSERCTDPRVTVVTHAQNLGVGGAVVTGYREALKTPAEVVIKLDGDGQMDPEYAPQITAPLLAGQADYAKGNRFHRIGFAKGMPVLRLFGNAVLSLLTKLSSGYWQLADPTNGYTAIRREVLSEIELDRVAKRYFFESDLLYHLNQIRALVIDIPMRARYEDEPSSLSPARVIGPFLFGHLRNALRRIGYSYFLRGFSVASIELLLGPSLLVLGTGFGLWQWMASSESNVPATPGTVMLAALPIILGMQMLLSWLSFDIAAEPRHPVHPLLRERQAPAR